MCLNRRLTTMAPTADALVNMVQTQPAQGMSPPISGGSGGGCAHPGGLTMASPPAPGIYIPAAGGQVFFPPGPPYPGVLPAVLPPPGSTQTVPLYSPATHTHPGVVFLPATTAPATTQGGDYTAVTTASPEMSPHLTQMSPGVISSTAMSPTFIQTGAETLVPYGYTPRP